MSTVFRPLGAKMLIRPDVVPTELKVGSIIVPESVKRQTLEAEGHKGTVVAMGPGMLTKKGTRWPMPDCKPGDRVLFQNYAASEIKIDDVLHIVVRDDSIIGVLDADA